MDINRLTTVYLKIRDERARIAQTFNEEDGRLKAQQARIEAELLRFLQTNGADSIKTEHATVYRQEDMKPSVADWDVLYNWIRAHDAFDALERRVKKGFVQEHMEQHGGSPPPGVSVYREYVVRVRRS